MLPYCIAVILEVMKVWNVLNWICVSMSFKLHIHAAGGIRTHNTSKWPAADPRLRRRAHWDRRQIIVVTWLNIQILTFCNTNLWQCTQKNSVQFCAVSVRIYDIVKWNICMFHYIRQRQICLGEEMILRLMNAKILRIALGKYVYVYLALV